MGEGMKHKLITAYICPPIPDRNFDWVAYYEDFEESGPYGSGKTELDAIEDLFKTKE
jgi:hypothetical protein